MGFFWFSVLAIVAFVFLKVGRSRQRKAFISHYRFPERVQTAVKLRYPHLSPRQVWEVMDGLREYFYLCQLAGRRMVAMPSQVVDVAWHEFILFTREYQRFCQRSFGRFLHHTPAEAMRTPTRAQNGIKTAWRLACAEASINARSPSRLPDLFSIDARLGIADGFVYALNCTAVAASAQGSPVYCVSHIGCASGCGGDGGGSNVDVGGSGGDAGSGGDGGGSGCSGGCGGGCGGGGGD